MVSTVVFSPVASVILGLSVLLSFSFFIYGINTLHLTRRARGTPFTSICSKTTWRSLETKGAEHACARRGADL